MTTTTSEQTVINIDKKSAPTDPIVDDEPLNFQPTLVEVVGTEDITTSKPAEETVLIDDPTNLKPQVKGVSMGPTARIITRALSIALLCFLGIISIIPFLQLIFGLKYAEQCPISRQIPHYLVVAGAVGLIGIALHMILNIYQIYSVTKSDEISPIIKLVLDGISIILLLLMIFLSVWFIAGCVWLFRVWSKVQYENPNEPDYCHRTLYRFTFWILLISVIYQLSSYFRLFLYGNSLIHRISDKKNKNGAIPVPTTEQ